MLCCHASSGWGRKQWKNGFQENVLSSNFPLLVATFLAKADHVRSWFVQFWSLDHGIPCSPGFVVTRCLQLGGHRSSSSLVWWRRESTLMILLVPLATSRVQVGLVDLLGDYDLCKVIVMTNTWRCLFHTIPLQSWGVAGLTVFLSTVSTWTCLSKHLQGVFTQELWYLSFLPDGSGFSDTLSPTFMITIKRQGATHFPSGSLFSWRCAGRAQRQHNGAW